MQSGNISNTMLDPYRILDLSDEKGFYAGQLLGNLGADVIKIEPPGGDEARKFGPFLNDIPEPQRSLFWLGYNTNKRGITLNLHTADGRKILCELVKNADVLVETFPPRYLDQIGLGYDALKKINSKLIMASITPFGQTGPYSLLNASDLICWAVSGLLFMTGDSDRPPVRVSHIPFTYLLASMDAAAAITIALHWRCRSGKGQHIDVSVQESANKSAMMLRERWAITGQEYPRSSSTYRIPYTETGSVTFIV